MQQRTTCLKRQHWVTRRGNAESVLASVDNLKGIAPKTRARNLNFSLFEPNQPPSCHCAARACVDSLNTISTAESSSIAAHLPLIWPSAPSSWPVLRGIPSNLPTSIPSERPVHRAPKVCYRRGKVSRGETSRGETSWYFW